MISILICTYDRGIFIDDTLRSIIIEQQNLKADEIIVVNGGGTNDCSQILDIWKYKCTYLKEIKVKNINLAHSRNIGLKECKGDLILMTDDDAVVFPDWIERMVNAHNDYPTAGAIGGEVVDASGKGLLNKVADLITFPRYDGLTKVRSLPGVNCSYKRKVLEMVGEQDVSMFRGEDVDFNWQIFRIGWDILYVPEIKVLHRHRQSWSGLFKQHHMYGRAYYRVRTKWQDMYCAYPRKLNTPRAFLKGIYFLLSPFVYAFIKSSHQKIWIDKIRTWPVIFLISYYSMWGTFKQWWYDRNVFSKT